MSRYEEILYSDTVNYVVNRVLSEASEGRNISIVLDIDKTIVFPTIQEGMIEAAPDAFYPDDLKETIIRIQGKINATCFAITGRSVDFIKKHFNLNGSGQFHAEMTDVFTGDHHILKPVMNLVGIKPDLEELTRSVGAYMEDDKSHHLCIMHEITPEFLASANGIVDKYNSSHDTQVTVEYGDDFFEVGPGQTCKGEALRNIMSDNNFFTNCFPLYCGDTPSKDGPAMDVALEYGGLAIAVGKKFEGTKDYIHVPSPREVHQILKVLSYKL